MPEVCINGHWPRDPGRAWAGGCGSWASNRVTQWGGLKDVEHGPVREVRITQLSGWDCRPVRA